MYSIHASSFRAAVWRGCGAALLLCFASPAPAAVGYVLKPMAPGYHLVCNPLRVVDDFNSITNVIPAPPEGTRVWTWNITNQTFDAPAIYMFDEWSSNLSLPPGPGFMVHTLVAFTNVFVGEVLQGSLTNFIAGTNRLSLLGSKVPQSGTLSGDLFFPGSEGDLVSLFNSTNQLYLDGCTYYTNRGWFDPTGNATTNGPVIPVATAFFVRHRGANTNWVRNFVVNLTGNLRTGAASTAPPPDIVGLRIQNGQATLTLNATDRPYHVQFSPDRLVWTTIATNQIGATWTGACPAPTAGYFQLITP